MADQDTQQEAMQKGQQVAQAGAAAAATSPPEQVQENSIAAMKAERDRVKLELPDAEIERIAAKLNELNIASFQEHGAFDAPPEAVQEPPAALPEPETGEPPATEVPPAAPQKQTFAHRYMGLGG